MTIKKVHQIWITDNNKEPSDFIKNQINRLKRKYYDYEHILWTNNSIIDFLSNNFDETILNSYKKVKPYAFKADLARYCILYTEGGLYIDSALCPMKKIDFTDSLVIAEGIFGPLISQNKPILENNFIACNKINHGFLKQAIDKCVINITNEYYHEHPLEVTGPIMLASIKDKSDITIATVNEEKQVKTTYVNNIAYMRHKKRRLQADLSKIKCMGTNNYEDMWYERSVY